jgi:hypothetical protein
MPINYKKYPKNWKTEIRPRILQRANNKCESCGVENYKSIFRGKLNGQDVYQDVIGNVYSAIDSTLISREFEDYLEETKPNQKVVKVILTIAHLDHDADNHNVLDDRLKALCQKCHLAYDKEYHIFKRKTKKGQMLLF